MRALVKALGRGQRTVILSSHLLEDVEQICDRVAVLQAGRLISEQTVAALRGPASLLVRARPMDRAEAVLKSLYGVDLVRTEDGALLIQTDRASASEVAMRLAANGVELDELRPVQRSLEAAFLEMTGSEGAPAAEGVAR